MSDPGANNPMVSEVSICNQALSWLGAARITSLADQTKTAQWMRDNYPFLRDAVLEQRMWSFATVRHESTQEMAQPDAWNANSNHPVPDGWLVVKRCFRDVSSADPNKWVPAVGWRREGQQVISYENHIYMQGIQRITNTNQYSSLFVQALAARIAAECCIPITENRALQSDMWNLASLKLADAAAIDGGQGLNDKVRSHSLVNARRYSGG